MAIHKGLRYDPGTKTILGYINSLFADQTQAQKEPEIASKVMVIMLKFIKKWRRENSWIFLYQWKSQGC
jgi:hypothetical protein